MEPLSRKGSELIEAARCSLRATAEDRERIESALRAHLGPSALPPEAPPAAPSPPLPSAAGPVVAKVVAGAGLVGGVLVASLAWPRGPTPTPPAADRSSAQAVTQAPPSIVEPPPVQQLPSVPSDAPKAAASARPRAESGPSSLAQEVQLLSRATSALKARRPADALRALTLHQRRFPTGVMVEERRVAKAQALCLLGRLREGRAELGLLPPRSPAAAQAERVCDAAAAPKPQQP